MKIIELIIYEAILIVLTVLYISGIIKDHKDKTMKCSELSVFDFSLLLSKFIFISIMIGVLGLLFILY